MTTHRRSSPTEYAGVRFRSRLEAVWAAFFDGLGWPWDYEPCSFGGWIPDFITRPDALPVPVFVEVKPHRIDDLHQHASRIIASKCDRPVLIVGDGPWSGLLGVYSHNPKTSPFAYKKTVRAYTDEWRRANQAIRNMGRPVEDGGTWKPTVRTSTVEVVHWKQRAYEIRTAAGDDREAAMRWAELVDALSRVSEISAGLMLVVGDVEWSDDRDATVHVPIASLRGLAIAGRDGAQLDIDAALAGYKLSVLIG